jgi:Icc-related predicted phosphoesterase
LAHPRLGQPAIRRAGERFDVGWIAPGGGAAAATLDGEPLSLDGATCDGDGVCRATATAAAPLGAHKLCVTVDNVADCSAAALAVVAAYSDPARIVQVSDAHVGDSDAGDVWRKTLAAINALAPPADLVIFTGDGADEGYEDQRTEFLDALGRLAAPVFVVTGNHDMDHGGTDHHLLDVGPELDYVASYGSLRLVGLSSGQDLDDGNHPGRLSEGDGPDRSQMDWLHATLSALDDAGAPTVVFFHHPLYNGLFGTVGPARDALLDEVTRDNVRAVLVGHVHHSEVYDGTGEDRGLSVDSDTVPSWRWPLHYTASRSTLGDGGYALHHIGVDHVDYRWVGLGG